MRWAVLLFAGCSSEPGPGLVDGGGFRFPDATVRDAGDAAPDTGAPDTGPFACAPACTGSEVCGCIAGDCGCHAPRTIGETCDPQEPLTCASGACVHARDNGASVDICSDGREGIACSHTADICTTALGCVCLTSPSGTTHCSCTETVPSDPLLCDPMVPRSCPGKTCVRTIGSTGNAYFVCSDGSEGKPCDPADGSCRTSLGCTCPLVRGRTACQCSEPSGEGGPCDPSVSGSCVAPLECIVVGSMNEGRSSVCSSGGMGLDGGVFGCNPNDPTTCPPGQACVLGPEGYRCE
jgi:hypothetical protein